MTSDLRWTPEPDYRRAAFDDLKARLNDALRNLDIASVGTFPNKATCLAANLANPATQAYFRDRLYRLEDSHKLVSCNGLAWYYSDGTLVT